MSTDLSQLPPPPKGQTGVTLQSLSSLPPPPNGQMGVKLNDIQQPQPSFIQQAVAPYAQQTQNDIQAYKSGKQGLLDTAINIGGSAISSAVAPFSEGVKRVLNMLPDQNSSTLAKVSNPLGYALNSGLQGASNIINKGVDIASNAISDIPAVQKYATSDSGENLSRAVAARQGYLNLIPAEAGVKTATQGFEDFAKGLPDRGTTNDIAKASFNDNLNKAIPVLKKDIMNLPQKQTNAQIAFKDIVDNQDKIKIYDDAGNIKTPTDYNFNDTVNAQQQRLPQIYKDYTAKLQGVDAQQFNDGIKQGIKNTIDHLDSDLAKENSVDNRKALTKIKGELSSLRDTSPEGIQNYIQTINQKIKPTAPGGALTLEQIKYANLAGGLRNLLDTSIEKLDGKGYQDLRNVYAAHKAIQSQLLQAAKSELNKTPGWTDRLTNVGMTGEGINFLLTHDPHALAVATGLKGSSVFFKWLKSPQRALQNMFKDVQRITPSPFKPSAINQNASIVPNSTSMSTNPTNFHSDVQRALNLTQ